MNKRPRAAVAVIEGTKGSPQLIELFAVTTSEDDLPSQLHDLARAFENRLVGLGADRVLIRRADTPPKPSNAEGPRTRLLVEGALASAARSHVAGTRLMNGRDAAALAGGGRTKAILDEEARAFASEPGSVAAVASAIALLDD
jgi:hypothetical protein